MSTPLSFCGISARSGQMPAPQLIGEQTGWNTKQPFSDCLCMALELREQNANEAGQDPMEAMTDAFLENLRKTEEWRKQKAKEDEENALMAVIDALNAPEEDKESGRLEQTLTKSLMRAGKAVQEQSEEILPDGSKWVTWVDPLTRLSVQVLLSCLGDRFSLEQVDEVQENTQEAREIQERETEEECLDVTEQRDLSDTGSPSDPTASDPITLERR